MRKHVPALVATALAVLLSVPATYALQRAYDVLVRTEPTPARVVWSAHIAMFWRLGVGAYLASMLFPFVFVAARRDLARTVRVLSTCVFVVGAIIGIQGLFMP